MLFDLKLAELRQHQQYVLTQLEAVRPLAYPALGRRLDFVIDTWRNYSVELDRIERQLQVYNPRSTTLDTFPQIFSSLRSVAFQMYTFIKEELPAYSTRNNDAAYSLFVAEMFREVGADQIEPVVSVTQGHGFATYPAIHFFPLVFVPHLVEPMPLDTALLYHELGHIVYQKWADEWAALELLPYDHAEERRATLLTAFDAAQRTHGATLIEIWVGQAEQQFEELLCDAIGVLVGGPAFTSALARLLLGLGTTIFQPLSPGYPPVDYRLRTCLALLRAVQPTSHVLADISSMWPRVRDINRHEKDPLYDDLYNEAYIEKVIASVRRVLNAHTLALYNPNTLGAHPIRDSLVQGAEIFHSSDTLGYSAWQTAFVARLPKA